MQGSPFFKKPYRVGCKLSLGQVILVIFYWWIINFMVYVALFNIIPRELFVICCIIVNIMTLLLMFPEFFDDYWIIENDGIKIKNYSSKNFKKLCQIIGNNLTCKQINYSDIASAEIIYRTKQRMSPFDISPDAFYLRLDSNQKIYHLDLSYEPKIFLPQFISYLSRKGVQVMDEHNIVEMLISGKSLYNHFNNLN